MAELDKEVAALKARVDYHEVNLNELTKILRGLEENLRAIVRLETQQSATQASLQQIHEEQERARQREVSVHERIESLERKEGVLDANFIRPDRDAILNTNARVWMERISLVVVTAAASWAASSLLGG